MAVSALVVTLRADAPSDALLGLTDDPRFQVGEAAASPEGGRRVPVVLDTSSPAEDRRAHEWLLERPGVASVDVVTVILDPEAS